MFEITLNGKTLYHPNSRECNVVSAKIHEELNDAGYMEITIPYTNPMYDDIQERNGSIIVYKDSVEMWYGQVRDISVDFSKNKTIYIVGEMSYLNDTVQPQRIIEGSKSEVLQEIINHHNSMCGPGKEFELGAIGNNANGHKKIVTNWEYSLDAIRNHLCGDEEYIRIKHKKKNNKDVRTIEIMPLESYGKRSTQNIMFGDNLLDYVEESSGEKIATVCIPLGATLEEGGIDDYENYITCESANNGKNYVELPQAINRLGRITKVVHFNVLTDPKALVTAATNYLQNSQYAQLSLELSAVDLSILHNDIDNYSVGDYIRAICEPMGMDAWFPIREKETDIINIANNTIKVGASTHKTLTKQQNTFMGEVAQSLQMIPSESSIMKKALANASNLINTNGTNGYVSIRTDEKGKPYELLVMNASSFKESTQCWRWNQNGLAHGTKAAGDESGFTFDTNVAMLMDGSIVAEKGSICGFDINMREVLNFGEYRNSLFQGNSKGSISLSFNETYGTGLVEIHNGSNATTLGNNGLITNGVVNAGTITASGNITGNYVYGNSLMMKVDGSWKGVKSYVDETASRLDNRINNTNGAVQSLANAVQSILDALTKK